MSRTQLAFNSGDLAVQEIIASRPNRDSATRVVSQGVKEVVTDKEDPYRFPKSREVGCFLGLRPGRRNSGESEP
jgi:transposase